MDLAAWLKGLGLERYLPSFINNDIDAEVLPRLTADDLIGLGVTSIGHRRKLLDEIAVLAGGSAVSISARFNVPTSTGAERRQLTVIFCDLVGSSALAAGDCMTATIGRACCVCDRVL
jgi:SAM domain (Sterile alpha motif)